jgi:hypothetical protein
VLSARPEIEPLRLSLAVAQEAAPAAVRAGGSDRRIQALALVAAPDDVEIPGGAMVLADAALGDRDLDRLARWLADKLRPG